MCGNHPRKRSKNLVLLACIAILGANSGCSLDVLDLISPLLKMGYNLFATVVNSALFGGETATGIAF